MSGYRLTPDNQIDDYGQERIWKMNKQAPRKRKSQIASSVEVFKDSQATVTPFLAMYLLSSFWKNITRMHYERLI